MIKLDIHAHILPKTWPSLKERYGYGGFIELDHFREGSAKMMRDDGFFFREIQENCWNPEVILQDMDKHSVDYMTLCTVPVLFNYWAKPEHGADWSRFLNDHLAQVCSDFPRFIGLGTAPMQDIDLAIKEMEYVKNTLNMPGLQIGSNINGMNLDDPSLHPFWAAAEELGVCIMVHPWEMAGADRMKRYFQEWLVGMPAETTLAITSMIFGGVFDKFPNLRVLFAHAGGSFPFTMEEFLMVGMRDQISVMYIQSKTPENMREHFGWMASRMMSLHSSFCLTSLVQIAFVMALIIHFLWVI